MRARIRAWTEALGDQFWVRPAVIVIFCIILAFAAISLEKSSEPGSPVTPFGYSGGAEGARALLGSVASSSIGVAGTIFSITIAALSLASAQMGPRLLRNFIRDSRNQAALGIFVGTFSYALVVLRTVRTAEEGAFIPHAAVTGSIGLALICVATLVWFVHHVATSINVETVVDAVHGDLVKALEMQTLDSADVTTNLLEAGTPIAVKGSNYLQAVDADGLAAWAAQTRTTLKLRVRPGDFVPKGMPIADVVPWHADVAKVLSQNLTFGSQPAALQDLEYYIRQLAEIGVRALSPGVNDPFTAASVLERFGDALCRLVPRHLATGITCRDGKGFVSLPVVDYGQLCDAMFNPIRQNASGSAYVMTTLVRVLAKVAVVERATERLEVIARHAVLAAEAGEAGVTDASGRDGIRSAYRAFISASDNHGI